MVSKLMYEITKSESGASYRAECRLCPDWASHGWDYRANALSTARAHIAQAHPKTDRLPVVHHFVDGGGIVTGTHDEDVARRFIRDYFVSECWLEEEPEGENFWDAEPRLQWGKCGPAGGHLRDEYSWVWMPLSEQARGSYRATVWYDL